MKDILGVNSLFMSTTIILHRLKNKMESELRLVSGPETM